jgi:site-specific DNA-methyltransferase (adenine-specific)
MNAQGQGGYNVTKNKLTRVGQSTDQAQQWEGWGTALKPAHEPIILARKPCSEKTVAANVLKWGTGAINIDTCRIKNEGQKIHIPQSDPSKRKGVVGTDLGISNSDAEKFQAAQRASVEKANEIGRWPANVVFSHSEDCGDECIDECPVKELDRQSGVSKSLGGTGIHEASESIGTFKTKDRITAGHNDAGGASRFFYVAKPSRREKNDGCEELPDTLGGSLEGGNDKRKGGEAGVPQMHLTKNSHPTVKPIKLMEYLCALITPPGGIILDPFLGSGTTGVAALNKGFRFVGIEREEEYMRIAQARIGHILERQIDEAA